MLTLVVYDIEEDRIRNKVAELCKDYGLVRIQYSGFVGRLNHHKRSELCRRLRRLLGRSPGNIQIWPICDKDVELRQEIDVAAGPGKYSDRYRRWSEECSSEEPKGVIFT